MISNLQKQHKLVIKDGMEYYTIDGMENVHAEMLRLLKIIDKVATDNGISYWIAGGSMIGVVRHHGFIPWDDDIDIELLKSDYIKLIKCLTDYCETHDEEFLFYSHPQKFHCCNYFASRKLFLRTQGSPNVYPVKVDIRPYNCIKKTEESIKENDKLKDIANIKVFGKSYGYVKKEDAKMIDTPTFFNKYNYDYGLYDTSLADCLLVPPYFEYSVSFTFNYANLFPLRKELFEDVYLPVPNDYDYILSSIYGDYMKQPKLEHRVPASCEVYMKELPMSLVKKQFGYNKSNRVFRWTNRMFFLVRFHGILNFLRYRFIEKEVVIGSNYEDSKNEW